MQSGLGDFKLGLKESVELQNQTAETYHVRTGRGPHEGSETRDQKSTVLVNRAAQLVWRLWAIEEPLETLCTLISGDLWQHFSDVGKSRYSLGDEGGHMLA